MIKKIPRFLKMKDYKSKDEKHPDRILIRLGSFEKSKSDYTTNIIAELERNGNFIPIIIPLKPHNSKTSRLWELWNQNVKSKNFKKGKVICLLTWKKGVKRFWKLSTVNSLR